MQYRWSTRQEQSDKLPINEQDHEMKRNTYARDNKIENYIFNYKLLTCIYKKFLISRWSTVTTDLVRAGGARFAGFGYMALD